MSKKQKTIEEQYKELDEIDHILLRGNMYIGSNKPHTVEKFLFSKELNKMELAEVTYIPAFLKLFDEIITNSVDEHKRKGSKLDVIKVEVDENKISVYDNGGISVEYHNDAKQYVPEMIFSKLRAGSNFDDTDERIVGGMNGLGSVLVNIYSKEFTVSTCDGKKKFYQKFSNNMRKRTVPTITDSATKHTKITYLPEYERFGMSGIDENHLNMLYKRTIDLAGTHPSIKFYFNGEQIKTKKFEDYVKFYVDNSIIDEDPNGWSLAVCNSEIGFKQVSFVNGVETSDAGTHVEYVLSQIIVKVREFINKKHKIDVKPSEIKNHLFLFLNTKVVNPSFSSQTKEKLITEPKDFGMTFEVSDKTINKIIKSEIVQSILDWYQQKKQAEENKELRKLNNSLGKKKVEKLIDAKGKDRTKCELFIFEGDSANSGFKKFRDTNTQGSFALRGKVLNVYDLSPTKVLQNEEIVNLMSSIGLRLGEKPTNLRYGKIYINADDDFDGYAICALVFNFLYKYWKDLFVAGMVYIVNTPLVVAVHKKSKKRLNFYNSTEYLEWEQKTNISEYSIDYKKGLSALEDEEYHDMIKAPYTTQIKVTDFSDESLNIWFGSDTNLRKKELLEVKNKVNKIKSKKK